MRYVWIDSLRIIQYKDDLYDWLREAALMNQVYSSSLCNLSASDARKSSEGLFRRQDPCTLNPTTVRLHLDAKVWRACEDDVGLLTEGVRFDLSGIDKSDEGVAAVCERESPIPKSKGQPHRSLR